MSNIQTASAIPAATPGAGRRRTAGARRGMALAATMLVMMGILSLTLLGVIAGAGGRGSGGVTGLTGNALQSSARLSQSTQAFNLAESGVEYALQWLHNQGGPPALNHAFPLPASGGSPGSPGVTYYVNGGTFSVTVFPDFINTQYGATNGNIGSTPKRYLVQSVGTYQGVTQIVQAYIQQTSFGKYAFFTDSDPSNIYWVGGRSSFDGPTHFNGSNGNPTQVVWVDGKPIFKHPGADAFDYSGSVSWHHNTSTDNTAPASNPDFLNVASIGATGVNHAPPITMPSSSLRQQYAALNQTMPAGANPPPPAVPLASGVTVTAGGGIYVHSANTLNNVTGSVVSSTTGAAATVNNDVQQMTLGVDGSGNQTISISQTDDNNHPMTTLVTINKAAKNPITQIHKTYQDINGNPLTSDSSVGGVTNGVVYCDGNIGSTQAVGDANGNPVNQANLTAKGQGLTGTIADGQALTIATYAAADQTDPKNKNVNLDGNVTYKTARARDASGNLLPESDPANVTFLQNAGTLGVVSNTVQIVDTDPTGAALGDIEVDASILAQNTLTAVDYGSYYIDQNSSGAIGSYQNNGQTYYYHWVRQPRAFTCMGGEIASHRGALGQFNSQSLQQVSGMSGSYSYDARLANTPPPYFPTTSTQYDILSWQRVAAAL